MRLWIASQIKTQNHNGWCMPHCLYGGQLRVGYVMTTVDVCHTAFMAVNWELVMWWQRLMHATLPLWRSTESWLCDDNGWCMPHCLYGSQLRVGYVMTTVDVCHTASMAVNWELVMWWQRLMYATLPLWRSTESWLFTSVFAMPYLNTELNTVGTRSATFKISAS